MALFKILFLLCVISLTACVGTPYIELGAGYNTALGGKGDSYWANGHSIGAHGAIGTELQVDDNISVNCEYAHYSQWFVGKPFNDEHENWLDSAMCNVRYDFK